MKRMLFIYNETAGRGALKQQLSPIINQFTRAGWLVTVFPTQGKGDAARVARELGGDYDRVVCAGGDGTLSQTVSGLMELSAPPVLGYVPAGSTNDCAHNLRLPSSAVKAAGVAAAGDPRAIDIGRINGKTFMYVAAFGAFTEVAYDTPQDLKNAFGHLAYIVEGVGQLANLTPYHLKVEYGDTVIEDDFLYGMVCNTYSVAGMKGPVLPSDRVVLDDGLFEVVLVRKNIRFADLTNVLQSLLRNVPVDTAAVVCFEADRVTISCDRAIPWTVDGEYGGTYAVSHLENICKAITVVHGEEKKGGGLPPARA